jgi:hypothetical protein
MVSPTTVELEEPVTDVIGSVEVVLRSLETIQEPRGERLSDFLRRLPPTGRTKEDVDRQINEERDSWGDR